MPECSYEGLFLEVYRLLPVDMGSGSLLLWMVLAFPSTYLIYLFKVRLQLEGKGRTQWPECQLPLNSSLPSSIRLLFLTTS